MPGAESARRVTVRCRLPRVLALPDVPDMVPGGTGEQRKMGRSEKNAVNYARRSKREKKRKAEQARRREVLRSREGGMLSDEPDIRLGRETASRCPEGKGMQWILLGARRGRRNERRSRRGGAT